MEKNHLSFPPPHCGHGQPLNGKHKYKAECPICGSFWDIDVLRNKDIIYDDTYPENRLHFNDAVGKIKIKTLQFWLKKTRLAVRGLNVCEVGFGGGFCLSYLKGISKRVYGIEVIPKNLDNAIQLGVDRDSLFISDSLPPFLPDKIDLWIFQDSFEHIPEPAIFMEWLVSNSSAGSKLLLVAPAGGSLSEKLLGRFWPHKVPDHPFHWSKRGLIDFFSKRRFIVERDFYPFKYASVGMIVAHMAHKADIFKGV